MRRRDALGLILAAAPSVPVFAGSQSAGKERHAEHGGHGGHGGHGEHEGHAGHAGHAEQSAVAPGAEPPVRREATVTRVRLADATLIDQDRRTGQLAKDFIGDRLVVATFVFAECGSYCPIISAVFAQFQKQMPADLARETVMISLSLDPRNDTPDVLKKQARQFGSRDGWRWLTGATRDVEAALKGFGAYSARPVDHQPNIVIGDPVAGTWYRYLTTPTVAQMLATTQMLQARRGKTRESVPHHDHGSHT